MPTWIVLWTVWRFLPKGHPRKRGGRTKMFTLKEWVAGETDYCRDLDDAFVLSTAALIFCVTWLLLI